MAQFLQYLDISVVTLEDRLTNAMGVLDFSILKRSSVMAFLQTIKEKDLATYDHSIRVGILAQKIGEHVRMDRKALLYAGLLHDIGKCQTRLATLQRTDGWTPADTEEIMHHVMDGYRMIRDVFDFSAEIILWHHRFQANGYPKTLPTMLHEYSQGMQVMIPYFGRMLSLADTFDALHRVNNKHGDKPMDGEQIKQKMLQFNKDQHILIGSLYEAGIFTTQIFPETIT